MEQEEDSRMLGGGLTKVVRGFQMFFPGKKESVKRDYKDKFPKKLFLNKSSF